MTTPAETYHSVAARVYSRYDLSSPNTYGQTFTTKIAWKISACAWCVILHQSLVNHLYQCEPFLEFAEIADALEQPQ